MSCLGVLFAVEPTVVDKLRQIDDDDDRVDFLQTEIEEDFFENQPLWLCDLGRRASLLLTGKEVERLLVCVEAVE